MPRRALMLVALASMATAGCGGAPPHRGAGQRAPAAPEQLPLRRAVGATLLLAFDGTRAPAYVLRILRRGDAAGVFLAPANVVSPGQLRALTRTLRHAGGPDTIVAVDQEGGTVRAVPWIGPAHAQPVAGSPAAVRRAAVDAAGGLRRTDVTMTLAPVADVPSVAGSFVAGRAYAGSPRHVAARVRSAVRGFRRGGVVPAVKHFPGLGGSTANTDRAPTAIAGVPDLEPFRAAIAAGAPVVMAGHGLYPALDPAHIASQSSRILGDLLRGRLGFRGVVMTDSLEARAVLARSSFEVAVVRSMLAGADLLLTTGRGSWIRADRALLGAARHDPALRARLRQAARRVRALRVKM